MTDTPHYKHLFFDMDGTVTRSRSQIDTVMREYLLQLMSKGLDVIIVSGQRVEAIRKQVGVGSVFMGQNGNDVYDATSNTQVWKEIFTDAEKKEVLKHIDSYRTVVGSVKNEDDLLEDRGSSMCFSFLGHNEDISIKEKFDPDKSFRKSLLERYPLVSDTIEVSISGTTTLDYVRKGYNKGYNIVRLINMRNWRKEECVYVGDALYRGGNDESVLGVIDTKEVSSPAETLEFIKTLT